MKHKLDKRTDPAIYPTTLNEKGHEVPDPTPLTLPSGFKRPETLAEQVQRLVRTHISAEAASRGDETFEEADDFETGEDDDPTSPYETFFDPVLGKDLSPQEFREREHYYRRQYIEAQKAYFQQMDRQRVEQRIHEEAIDRKTRRQAPRGSSNENPPERRRDETPDPRPATPGKQSN